MTKRIDLPLPIPAAKVDGTTREELVALLGRVVKEARLPPGKRRAGFVRLPAEVWTQCRFAVEREVEALAERAAEE